MGAGTRLGGLVFSDFVVGKDLTRDQAERFKAFLGRTKKVEGPGGSSEFHGVLSIVEVWA